MVLLQIGGCNHSRRHDGEAVALAGDDEGAARAASGERAGGNGQAAVIEIAEEGVPEDSSARRGVDPLGSL